MDHPRANPGFRSEPPAAKGPGCAYMHPIFRVIQWSLRSSMAPLRVSFSRFCTAPTGLSGSGVCSTAAVHRPASAVLHCSGVWHPEARNEALASTASVVAHKRLTQLVWTSITALLSAARWSRVHGSSEGHAGHSSVAVAKYCATAVAVTLNTTVSVRMLLTARLYPV